MEERGQENEEERGQEKGQENEKERGQTKVEEGFGRNIKAEHLICIIYLFSCFILFNQFL